jgi:hypothetical protein
LILIDVFHVVSLRRGLALEQKSNHARMCLGLPIPKCATAKPLPSTPKRGGMSRGTPRECLVLDALFAEGTSPHVPHSSP